MDEETPEQRQSNIRKEIAAIQADKSLTPQEKAQRMQLVMSGRYRKALQDKQDSATKQLDLNPTYHKENIFGCQHYRKNCKIKAVCCGQFFTCRRCHDEAIPGHKINRYLIAEMLCFFCNTIQPVAGTCAHCQKSMAKYYCGVCKFFDDDEKKNIWHCEQCGLCRVGRGQMEHCTTCNCCMPAGHTEHSEMLHNNCPICSEDLFTSTRVSFLPDPCKHAIHTHCFKDHLKHGNYSCPICSRTYSQIDMAPHWAQMDLLIASHPMPDEYKDWKTEFLCNDCNVKEIAVWHFFGQKCSSCKGYNTKITATFRPDGSLEENPPNMDVDPAAHPSLTEGTEEASAESDEDPLDQGQ